MSNAHKMWTTKEENMLISYKRRGLSNKEIGKKMGRSTTAIRAKYSSINTDNYSDSSDDEYTLEESKNTPIINNIYINQILDHNSYQSHVPIVKNPDNWLPRHSRTPYSFLPFNQFK